MANCLAGRGGEIKIMRLLVFTQHVGTDNPVLGFFHDWLIEFAKGVEHLTVIGLSVGQYDLPKNVSVLSLGKELGRSRLRALWRFYFYLWKLRGQYDAVFVHMNQEYVLLGGPLWRLCGKRVCFWRNHPNGSILTSLAVFLSNKVFCTSEKAYVARFEKSRLMPVGIDTDFFKENSLVFRKPNSFLFLGRIDPVKKVEVFVEALKVLSEKGVDFTATVAGESSPKFEEYGKTIREKTKEYGLEKKVAFLGATQKELSRQLYQEHQVYVNLTPDGSLDKTIFEAMACGAKIVTPNSFFKEIKDFKWLASDLIDVYKISATMEISLIESYNQDLKNRMSDLVDKNSLKSLIENILNKI